MAVDSKATMDALEGRSTFGTEFLSSDQDILDDYHLGPFQPGGLTPLPPARLILVIRCKMSSTIYVFIVFMKEHRSLYAIRIFRNVEFALRLKVVMLKDVRKEG